MQHEAAKRAPGVVEPFEDPGSDADRLDDAAAGHSVGVDIADPDAAAGARGALQQGERVGGAAPAQVLTQRDHLHGGLVDVAELHTGAGRSEGGVSGWLYENFVAKQKVGLGRASEIGGWGLTGDSLEEIDRRIAFFQRDADAVVEHCRRTQSIGFMLRPTSMAELMRVADADSVMPPKSTLFSPKTCAGVVLRLTE